MVESQPVLTFEVAFCQLWQSGSWEPASVCQEREKEKEAGWLAGRMRARLGLVPSAVQH